MGGEPGVQGRAGRVPKFQRENIGVGQKKAGCVDIGGCVGSLRIKCDKGGFVICRMSGEQGGVERVQGQALAA